MKSIQINGTSVTITSNLKLEEIKFVETYDVNATILKDKNDTQIFRIGTGFCGNMTEYGITFARENSKGYAEVTLVMDENVKDIKDAFVKASFGMIEKANAVEEQIAKSYKALNKKFKEFGDTIKTTESE